MSDALLPYYNRELSFIRRMGAEFAEAHPKIAGRLKIGPESIEDPHVSRLIEAFAFLNARVRHKLDDTFPEITDALLGVLYPHYLAPIPSMAIVRMEPPPDTTTAANIDRGVGLETQPIDGEPCRFRTCYQTAVWPVEVSEAKLAAHHTAAPSTAISNRASSVLHLRVSHLNSTNSMAETAPDSLRLYIHGEGQLAFDVYELLMNDALEVAVTSGGDDAEPLVMSPDSLSPVGFGRDEGMLPYSSRSFVGYRLLSEYFVFPEKFLFFDLKGIGAKTASCDESYFDVFVYLNRTTPDLERGIDAGTFLTGCTPVVNLFEQRAEPIQLTHSVSEYRVVPDARRPKAMEVYAVNDVNAASSDGDRQKYLPFYGIHHADLESDQRRYWHTARRSLDPRDPGTEVFLSLVNLDFQPFSQANTVLEVAATCLNRDLPNRLPFGGGDPRLHFSEAMGAIKTVKCMTRPTETRRPEMREKAVWGLISHLTLNHLSLAHEEDSSNALREILKLYDVVDSPQSRALIDGVMSVSVAPAVGRLLSQGGAVCRGLGIDIRFDRGNFSGNGLFLFASVLEQFLTLYCSINSFTQLTATEKGQEGALRKWPPRAGEKVLL